MIIIGITGTLGTGKGTVVEYLVKRNKFKHYSVSDFLKEELVKQGRKIDRTNLQDIGNELRKKFGPDYIVKKLFEKAKKKKHNTVIESIRNPKEAEFIKSHGGFLLAVTAAKKTRYQRIKSRAGEKDNVTYEEFVKQEEGELQSSDLNAQNLPKCILMADYKFANNSTIKCLYEKVEKAISKIQA
jgi:dephospho-CoA kinase